MTPGCVLLTNTVNRRVQRQRDDNGAHVVVFTSPYIDQESAPRGRVRQWILGENPRRSRTPGGGGRCCATRMGYCRVTSPRRSSSRTPWKIGAHLSLR